ncbi:MAG: TRAP transporter large permease [Eubacteriales bacterium]|jgi:C4-dicarboxylate transporter DctM subunit
MEWVVIAVFLGSLLLNVKIGFAMLITSILYVLLSGELPVSYVVQSMISGITNYTVMAVPFFILAGFVMNGSSLTRKIFNFADTCVGHLTGGLAHVNILASFIFAGMSGSANADAAGLGNIEIVAMKEKGYDTDFSVGITAVSSIIGPIVPPSNPMVNVGIIAGVSIGAMFLGGISVGILMALFMAVVVYIISRKRNFYKRPRASAGEIWHAFKEAFWALLAPVILLGGILNGNITPTEAGAATVIYALFISIFVYRDLNLKELIKAFEQATVSIGLIMLLLAAGKVFSWVIGDLQIAEKLADSLFGISNNPWVILLIINLFLLVMGMLLETNAAIVIAAPILFPIAEALGMNVVQFGIVFVLNLMIGLLTPPMAIVLFITSKIGGISFQESVRAVKPYYVALLILLVLVNLFPVITLGIPHLVFGNYL